MFKWLGAITLLILSKVAFEIVESTIPSQYRWILTVLSRFVRGLPQAMKIIQGPLYVAFLAASGEKGNV